MGLPLPLPPETYFCFFSAGFSILGSITVSREPSQEFMEAYLERTEQTLVYTHHCSCVVEFTTIIWRAE